MVNKKNYKSIFTLLSLLSAFSIQAAQDDRLEHFISLSLEDLVSLETTIATASKQTTTQAPAVVTLITAEDIKATGASNLVDVLEGVPGIHIRTSQFANRPLIQFRGAKATQTLLMVNGASMKDLVWGFGIFWKGFPASIIERIEIIRGPGSALFGADAAAGVINIITKTAGKIKQSEAGVRIGSFNTLTTWMQHGDNWGGFDIGLTAELSSTDGHSPLIQRDAQTATDELFGTSVSYAPGKAQYGWRNQDIRFSIAKDHWRILLDYVTKSDLEIGLTGAGVLDPTTLANDRRYDIDWIYNNSDLSENWDIDMELRYQDLNYNSGNGFLERPAGYRNTLGLYPRGVVNHMESAERRIIFETSGLYTGIKNHALRIGTGYTWQDLYIVRQHVNSGTGPDGSPLPAASSVVDVSNSPFAFAPEKTRIISHIFVQDIWNISPAWELTAGTRYDKYSDFGGTMNPRLALVWLSSEKLTSKLIYGQAFRDPSYQELFAETSRSLPNPNLAPESSKTIDLSFSYIPIRSLQLGTNFFIFDQSDIIVPVEVGKSKKQFQNTGDHQIKGIELETRWQAADNISFYINYTHREQAYDGFRAVQEPSEEAYFRSDWGFSKKWNWNLQFNWIGKRTRPASDTRSPVASYLVTDSTLGFTTTKNWEFSASIRNLLNADTREYTGSSIPGDLPLAERNAYVDMRYKF